MATAKDEFFVIFKYCDLIGMNITGLYLPAPLPQDGFVYSVIAFALAVLLTFADSQKKKKTSAAIRTNWKKTPRTLASFTNFDNVVDFQFIFDRSNLTYS